MSSAMTKPKVVLHWVDALKVSIEDLSTVNEEDRYVGAPTSIKVGKNYHNAVVKLISSDPLKLDAMEEQVSQEIDVALEAQKKKEDKTGRSSRHKRQSVSGAATTNQVASAMGERLKPSNEQVQRKKELAEQKKAATVAHQSAQDDVDRCTLGPCHNKARVKLTFDYEDADVNDSTEEGQESESEDIFHEVNDGDNAVPQSGSAESCCSHCRELQRSYNLTPSLFLKTMLRICSRPNAADNICFLEVQQVPHGVPKCELSKGSSVFISVSDKNSIKREGDGDPAKMVRLGLIALFGREVLELEDVTAKGTRNGSKGIQPNVRKALLGFVNRNKRESFKPLTESTFNHIINKKKCQMQRQRKQQASGSKKLRLSKPASHTTAMQSSENSKESPRKDSPLKSTPKKTAKKNSPLKQMTPRKNTPKKDSPFKNPGNSWKSSWEIQSYEGYQPHSGNQTQNAPAYSTSYDPSMYPAYCSPQAQGNQQYPPWSYYTNL